MKTWKSNRKIDFLLLFLLLSISLSAAAETVKLGLQPGKTYEYNLVTTHSSSSRTLASVFSHNAKPMQKNFSLSVIDFQNDAFIVDIKTEQMVYRRYIKPDGQISGAPAEAGSQIPFFLTFPAGDWQVGQRHQIKRTINIGRQSFPAGWQLLLKSINKEQETAEIVFACAPELPASKLAMRKYSLKGRLIFDLAQGLINQADWSVEYSFNLQNREIAVARNLWQIQEKTVYSLKLANIAE